ncbi:MAG: hypothetical protein U9P80_05825 [Thermodesulfobacteriota bacterium]|nr:hypothetical protein [Thermodesulfobacteriota bacterium]
MKHRALIACCLLLLVVSCGRKLPPQPPAAPERIEIESMEFKNGSAQARVTCNVIPSRLIFLGKPWGGCPRCTDDLDIKDTKTVEKGGTFVLIDPNPQSNEMLYRVVLETEGSRWMSKIKVVREKNSK